MKLKKLLCALEDVEMLDNPKIKLDKYIMSPHIAACVLNTAQTVFNDIAGKRVANIGCGSGVFCIGAALLNAIYCTGFDIDPAAISLSVKNATNREVSNICDFILCNVDNIDKCMLPNTFDTVIVSLPFNIKLKGTDIMFLKCALNISSKAVYLTHKTKLRSCVMNLAKRLGAFCKVIAVLQCGLPVTNEFYQEDLDDTEVDLLRFTSKPIEN